MIEPHHLAKFNTVVDNNFSEHEVVYRRCPFGNHVPPYRLNDLFLDIRWDTDLVEGLSVNRSKFSKPIDALWSPITEDTILQKCEFQRKEGIVVKAKASLFPTNDLKTGILFTISHSPINCNISHCDIIASGIPNQINKTQKRDAKAFLASLFQDISKEEMEANFRLESMHKKSVVVKEKENKGINKKHLFLVVILTVILMIMLAFIKRHSIF